jgi:hypothetical protein
MEESIKEHIEAFGIEPNIIGMFWSDQEKVIDGIEEAIENNQPYDEYLMLSEEDRAKWDSGRLKF